ncbi:hypothetical protein SAMN05660226_03236 [Parapedobacter luteus]|uniref:Uncharacterized protein n=1 Tax=Parapedobacter luteus TaxID=623280 RepID=A0A1T5EBQ7_9SPHI|nr:hypothetical protein [Parapedobacter luteus]SKB81333.1 hypothetical protein SAMN05660226_03236 [Parapedobacter luteus]
MSVLFEDSNVEKYTAECSLTYSSFIYCMMLNRLSRGYSALELSFLLGQDDDFIRNMERFEVMDFSIELYGQLCRVFCHTNFLQHQHHGEPSLRHEMHSWKAGDTIFYRMECYKSDYESIVLFQLCEEDPAVSKYRYENSVKDRQQAAQDGITEMFVHQCFDKPIEPHRLYRQLESLIGVGVDPVHFKTELDKLVGRKGKAPLKRTKRRSFGYRYVLHPGVNLAAALDFITDKFNK